jgi:nucleoside-diphosphate-sugar epimerase
MRILVSGGLGFIGHEVVKQLEGHDVMVIDSMTNYDFIPLDQMMKLFQLRQGDLRNQVPTRHIDLRDRALVAKCLYDFQPEVVIHLASFPRQKVVLQNPSVASEVMTTGLINLLEASKGIANKFVYISSSMVYGDFNDRVPETQECHPRGQYAIMKYMGEKLVEDYKKYFDYTIIRPSAVYGPRDVEDRVLSKFVLNALRGNTIQVRGADEVLDFTYVTDTAQGIALAATKECPHDIYNITRCEKQPITLHMAARKVVELLGKGKIELVDRDQNFPSRGRLDITRAQKDLGYNPTVDFNQGCRDYVDWMRTNINVYKEKYDTVY